MNTTTRILVIDDAESFREIVKSLLELEGFDVITASNGKEGLDLLYRENPDLVLLDCIMPEMDGYDVVKVMRQDPILCHKPVIMLTGMGSEYDEIKGLALGIDDYIVKPFNPPVLMARVKALLQRKAQSISANPLTFLSGNVVIKSETEKRLANGLPFAMIYADISNFKSFNDRYGFDRGDDVIKQTARILLRSVGEHGRKGDFVGHIGGDDFIVLTLPECFPAICDSVIQQFDQGIPSFYDEEDRRKGGIISIDRRNVQQQFPFMTISLAVISTQITAVRHYGQLSGIAADLKKLAKKSPTSTYVVERRKS